MNLLKNIALLVVGAIIGAVALFALNPMLLSSSGESGEPEPLYWVAPMDPNYRREGPGKSPMGMDLVPVYEEDEKGGDNSPGTIEIAPEVVNNLGVRTAKVTRGSLEPDVRTVGYLQYNEDSIVHIHPRVDGWIEQSYVTSVGDPIEKGQKLYTLYSPALVNAQEELLFGHNRNDQRMVRAAEQRLRALQISEAFIRELKRSGKVSQTVTFYAPASGVVDNLNMREGFYVQPGMTLMSIANLDEIWLEAEVLERQAGLIEAGLPVEVRLDYLPGEVLQGKIDYVYPSLDSKTRTLRVRVRMQNPEHALKPNMFAELRIVATDQAQRVLVPKEAVIRGGQQDRVVLALGEGRFKSIAVKTGQRDNQQVEILQGLKSGEKVVISAQFLLDSESSRTSDFSRIDSKETSKQEKPSQVWVEITVNSVDTEKLKANVDHAAIEAWMWPKMTMDFQLDEYLDFEVFQPGLVAHAQITRTPDKKFVITDLHIPDEDMSPSAPSTEPDMAVDHSNHQMEVAGPEVEKATEKPNKVWVKATINSIDAAAMKLNAQHEAIPEWQWPQMVMDFKVSAWVELEELPINKPLHLEVSRTEPGGYEVTDFFLAEDE